MAATLDGLGEPGSVAGADARGGTIPALVQRLDVAPDGTLKLSIPQSEPSEEIVLAGGSHTPIHLAVDGADAATGGTTVGIDCIATSQEDASEYDDVFQAARAAVRRKWSRANDLERLREYLRRKDFASDGTIKERVFLHFLRASCIAAELSDAQMSRLVTALDTKGDQWID